MEFNLEWNEKYFQEKRLYFKSTHRSLWVTSFRNGNNLQALFLRLVCIKDGKRSYCHETVEIVKNFVKNENSFRLHSIRYIYIVVVTGEYICFFQNCIRLSLNSSSCRFTVNICHLQKRLFNLSLSGSFLMLLLANLSIVVIFSSPIITLFKRELT